MSNNELIKNVAAGWKTQGHCLPCEVVVRDVFPLPIPHSERDARWCVFLTYSQMLWVEGAYKFEGYMTMSADTFLGEFDSQKQANRAAGQYRRTLYAAYDAA